MYQPLLLPRISSASLSLPPRRPHHVSSEDHTSEMPVRLERFIETVKAALKVVAPTFADSWFVDTEVSNGMVLCSIHVPGRDPNCGSHWRFISSPAVKVLIVPFADSRVEVSPCPVSALGRVDTDELARSLRRELSKSGRYSVAEPSGDPREW